MLLWSFLRWSSWTTCWTKLLRSKILTLCPWTFQLYDVDLERKDPALNEGHVVDEIPDCLFRECDLMRGDVILITFLAVIQRGDRGWDGEISEMRASCTLHNLRNYTQDEVCWEETREIDFFFRTRSNEVIL